MPHNHRPFHFAQIALEALRRAKAFEGLVAQPSDAEVIPNFSGRPERTEAWLIFESPREADDAAAHLDAFRMRASDLLADAGFPKDALGTFVLRTTSIHEIEARGGRRAFFR